MSGQAVLLPKWSPRGESFWQKDSLITHIFFESCLLWYLAECTFFLFPLYILLIIVNIYIFCSLFRSLNIFWLKNVYPQIQSRLKVRRLNSTWITLLWQQMCLHVCMIGQIQKHPRKILVGTCTRTEYPINLVPLWNSVLRFLKPHTYFN